MSQSATPDPIHREDTLEAYQRGVGNAIQMMHERFSEQLTVAVLADSAFMSRYHFGRVFSKITGASPARFLAAVRMQEAKRLLLQTGRSVTEICYDVGYGSLGTFTRIFTDFVGFSPMRFRQLSLALLELSIEGITEFLPYHDPAYSSPSNEGDVVCKAELALVAVAVFQTPIPRSHPSECICLRGATGFSLHEVSSFHHIFAAGVAPGSTMSDALLVRPGRVFVGKTQVDTASATRAIVTLREHDFLEPPVVVAFPLLIAKSLMVRDLSILGEGIC